ncbi:MAG: DUF4340 domain-containing protein [Phycisphaerales bacterium JB038]
MSRTPTIILIVLALVLAVAAFIILRTPAGPAEPQPLLGPASQPIERFTVYRDGYIICQAERRTISNVPGWLQTAPIEHPLLTTAVETLLREALALTTEEPARGDAVSLGFKPIRASIEVDGLGTLDLGRRTVAGKAIVRQRGEGDAYTVDDTLHRLLLDGDPVAWRKRDLFDNLSVEVGRVRLTRGEETLHLARLRGAWRVLEPVGEVANETAVQQLLAYLIDSDVQSFILDEPDDLARFGLAEPSLSVTVETYRKRFGPGGEVEVESDTQTLHIGGPADIAAATFYAKRGQRDCVTTVAAPLVAMLGTPLTDLLSPVAAPLQQTDIAAVELDQADQRTTLTRTLEGWAAAPALGDRTANQLAEEVLTLLCVTEALEVALPAGDADRPPAAVTITLRGYDTSDLARFEVRRDGPDTILIRNTTNGITRAYPASDGLASFLE